MNEEVTQYINKLPSWQVDICEKLRKIVFTVIPDVQERIQYGKPHYQKNGSYACVITASKEKVTFMIFNATELDEIGTFFKATTAPDRKTATIKQDTEVDYDLLSELLSKASANI